MPEGQAQAARAVLYNYFTYPTLPYPTLPYPTLPYPILPCRLSAGFIKGC